SRTQLRYVQQVRYKPGRRCLVECQFVNDLSPNRFPGDRDESAMFAIGKIRCKGLDRRTPELHEKLWQSGFDRRCVVRVPRFLGYIPSINLWFQERIEACAVTPDSGTALATHRNVARALAGLHRCGIEVDRIHTLHDEFSILCRRLEEVVRLVPRLYHDVQVILAFCESLVGSMKSVRPVLIHRDFYFDQVLSAGRQTVILDLDLAAMGPAELDAGNYIAHLLEYAVRVPAAREYCQEAASVFAQGYLEANPDADPAALRFLTILSLARHIWLSTMLDGRAHTTPQLIDMLLSTAGDLQRSVG
ncbi:MAG: phosphotransferase, partial [Planctomycetaceae bacterium]|nr:phosphotransferase [Planctomycetaceae bacterium]